MPVAHLVRVDFHGVGLGEEFQFGAHVVGPAPSGFSDLQAAVDDMVTAFTSEDWGNDLRSFLSTDQHYDKITAEYWDTSGGPADLIAIGLIAPASGVGTGAQFQALQNCLVATTRTEEGGPNHRGRMYVPTTGLLLGAGHQYSSGICTLVAQTMTALMDSVDSALATHTGGVANWAVYSPSLDTASEVTRVSVDSRPDIQRRRAGSQVPIALEYESFA